MQKRHPRMLAALFATALLFSANPAAALEAGDKAPTFAARALDGSENVSLAKYRGKVVYLDFWASWCGPCLKSLPLLEEMRKEFPAEDFQLVAINLDKDLEKARKFLLKHQIGYPSASDPDGKLPGLFEVKTMPTSFLIDRQGVIRYVHEGFRPADIDEIRERVRQLVEAH